MCIFVGINEDLNLISRQMSFQDLLDNHVIDCFVALVCIFKKYKNVADFGSGGGLPAVIYAFISWSSVSFCMRKVQKKQRFCSNAKLLHNMHIHAEIPKGTSLDRSVDGPWFKPIDVILDMSRAYVQKVRTVFSFEARREKIQEEIRFGGKKFKSLRGWIVPLESPVLEIGTASGSDWF